jgi:hypothetical protein
MRASIDAQNQAREVLEPGEELLWAGQPIPAIAIKRSIVIFLFGLFWTVLSVFWLIIAVAPLLHTRVHGAPVSGIQVAFVFFGAPFMIVGLVFLSSPYWAYRAACETLYAITNKRIIVTRVSKAKKVRSHEPQTLQRINHREKADGVGDLLFHIESDDSTERSPDKPAFGFYGIADVREVENIIRKAFPEIAR